MSKKARSVYGGPRRKLVIAFDVGTTYSGASYSILTPGQVPEIRGVTRFPAQEHVGGDCKIPSIMYYDKDGVVKAAGAEAMKEDIVAQKEDEEWVPTPWFKLHLRPKNGVSTPTTSSQDFLRYLYSCTRTYIEETHGFSGDDSDWWQDLERQGLIDFVLSHPNGWEGAQQEMMRRAAPAGRVGALRGGGRFQGLLRHGRRGEFALLTGAAYSSLDAGGGTVDLSAYARAKSEDWFEEIATPQ
ncbi:hypothetical protein DFP72DRAFT_1110160, partial [Ephemerocybe angulata]